MCEQSWFREMYNGVEGELLNNLLQSWTSKKLSSYPLSNYYKLSNIYFTLDFTQSSPFLINVIVYFQTFLRRDGKRLEIEPTGSQALNKNYCKQKNKILKIASVMNDVSSDEEVSMFRPKGFPKIKPGMFVSGW